MRLTVVAAVIALIAPSALAQSKSKLYSSSECGMSFQVPAGWVVTPSKTPIYSGAICSLDVQPIDLKKRMKDVDDVEVYWLSVTTLNESFDSAADEAGFERRGEKWVVIGRQGIEDPTDRISRANWSGISGSATVGCFGPEGYAGLCENPRAVISDRAHTSAIIDGGPQAETAYDLVLKTFRFIPRQNTYRGEEAWEQVCANALAQPLPQEEPTGPLPAAQLPGCDATALYYVQRNYAAALQCGWYQRAHPRDTVADLVYGPGVLSMLYANGFGVPRNYDRAIRFACEDKWTGGTEQELRIGHLEHLRDAKANATFDVCDDITSGLNQGACADIAARKKDAARDQKLEEFKASLPPAAQALFAQLQQAEQAFEESRVNTEIDLTGTARSMFQINDQTKLRDQFLINLERFEHGEVPQASKDDVTKLDRQLNETYRRIEDSPAAAWANTTVKHEGIRATERKWVELQDAWMKFAAVTYPELSPERVRAQLIRLRLHQLRAVAPGS